MPLADPTRAITVITGFRNNAQQAEDSNPGMYAEAHQRRPYDALVAQMHNQLPLIEAIAREVDPEVASTLREHLRRGHHGPIVDCCDLLLGTLNSASDIEAIVGPAGPRLAASQLHPWVWNAASEQWDASHRRDAIQRAATAVFDRELRAKVQIYDRQPLDLAGLFHISDPAQGELRLRVPGFEVGTPEWRDIHTGTMELAKGAISSIRNLATHDLDEPEEAVALEQLAVLSVLARRIDEAAIEIGPALTE